MENGVGRPEYRWSTAVLDPWFERRFKKTCQGYAGLTRSADDFVATFRYLSDAKNGFGRGMEERLAAFGLHVAPEKSALLYFKATNCSRKVDLAVGSPTSCGNSARRGSG